MHWTTIFFICVFVSSVGTEFTLWLVQRLRRQDPCIHEEMDEIATKEVENKEEKSSESGSAESGHNGCIQDIRYEDVLAV